MAYPIKYGPRFERRLYSSQIRFIMRERKRNATVRGMVRCAEGAATAQFPCDSRPPRSGAFFVRTACQLRMFCYTWASAAQNMTRAGNGIH